MLSIRALRGADRRSRLVRLGAQASSDGSRANGSRGRAAGCGNRWLPKRGEGRLRPEPNLPAMPSWGGVRAQRRGGGAGSEWRTLRGLCGNELVSDSGRRHGGSEHGAAEAGNGGGDDAAGSVSDEGHRPESPCGRSRSPASRELESSGSRLRFAFGVPALAARSRVVERSDLVWRPQSILQRTETASPACRSGQGKGAAGERQLSGDRQLERRACGETQRIPKALSRRLCRDGGGNTAAPRSMWLFGCVQSALALSSEGLGDSSSRPPGGAGGREERAPASFERRRLRSVRRRAPSMLGRCSRGDTQVAPNVHAGNRQASAAAHEKAEGANGISHEIAEVDSPETLRTRVADATSAASHKVPESPSWQDRLGSICGGDTAESFDRSLPSRVLSIPGSKRLRCICRPADRGGGRPPATSVYPTDRVRGGCVATAPNPLVGRLPGHRPAASTPGEECAKVVTPEQSSRPQGSWGMGARTGTGVRAGARRSARRTHGRGSARPTTTSGQQGGRR